MTGPQARAGQAFRLSSSTQQHYITTRLDPKTGQHIVLWRDVLMVFKNAYLARDSVATVPYLVGDDFEELVPRRIAYYPDTVLEIVLEEDAVVDGPRVSQVAVSQPAAVESPSAIEPVIALSTSSHMEPAVSTPPQTSEIKLPPREPQEQPQVQMVAIVAETEVEQKLEQISVFDDTEATVLINNDNDNSNNNNNDDDDEEPSSTVLVLRSATPPSPSSTLSVGTQSSFKSYQSLYNDYLQAIMSGQVTQANGIKDLMNTHFTSLKVEMDKNADLQQKLVDMSTKMLKMQQIALDRLSNLQTQIKAVLTQTYELHEYPIPRLFIVLPKVGGKSTRDKILKPFSQQFRLYFLCECGRHTTKDGATTIDEVHLAKHEGYDIEQPTEFFRKYGNYIMAMMQMLKIGVSVAGVVVPQLAHFNLVEGLDMTTRQLHDTKNSIHSLVDETIAFIECQQGKPKLEDLLGSNNDTNGSRSGAGAYDNLEALEGVELKQLENFLQVADKARAFGNLYRTVTSEGHVKWVCQDHFRANVRASAQQQFLGIVDEHGGVLDETLGSLTISLGSKTVAKPFYAALEHARGIFELQVELAWDASMEDLRKFANAINKSNVTLLIVHSDRFSGGPATDIVNRNRRYTPLIELLGNGRLQTVEFSIKDLFHRVDYNAIPAAPQIRAMCTAIDQSWNLYHYEVWLRIMQRCTGLQRMVLDLSAPYTRAILEKHMGIINALLRAVPRLQELEILKDRTHGYQNGLASWVAKLKKDSIKNMLDEYGNKVQMPLGLKYFRMAHRNTEGRVETLVEMDFFDKEGGFTTEATFFADVGPATGPDPDFIMYWGYALKYFDVKNAKMANAIAKKWESSIKTFAGGQRSKLEALDLCYLGMTTADQITFARIAFLSPNLRELGIEFDERSTVGQARLNGRTLSSLDFFVTSIELKGQLEFLRKVQPPLNKTTFPNLTSLIWDVDKNLNNTDLGWLISLVSTKNLNLTTPAAIAAQKTKANEKYVKVPLAGDSTNALDALEALTNPTKKNAIAAVAESTALEVFTGRANGMAPLPLTSFGIKNANSFKEEDWRKLIRALDFRHLEFLMFKDSKDFDTRQFGWILAALPEGGVFKDGTKVILETLSLENTTFSKKEVMGIVDGIWQRRLTARAPFATLQV